MRDMTGEPSSHAPALLLRQIPSVDELANRAELAEMSRRVGRELVVEAARSGLGRLRQNVIRNPSDIRGLCDGDVFDASQLAAEVAAELASRLAPSLRTVINATGVVLHTNLGRAPLSAAAIEHMRVTAGYYTNLEYDLVAGT